MHRRRFLTACLAFGAAGWGGRASAAEHTRAGSTLIGAAWRGPRPDDPYFAGLLHADWRARRLSVASATRLPTRAHGLTADADGSLLICGVRPGQWLLRCDARGNISQQVLLADEGPARLNGHAVFSRDGSVVYTTETDSETGAGLIGVRDARSLKKLDQWPTAGKEPHQLLLDDAGHLMVANGGIPRTGQDKKYDLHRMDSSLVHMDGQTGAIREQWTLADRRLSLRHLAWSDAAADGKRSLGIAMQAEHDDPKARAQAPTLAVLEGGQLRLPVTNLPEGGGYAGDIAPAYRGGFALSNNQIGLAQLWYPAREGEVTPLVRMEETYALAPWGDDGGLLVASAPGLIRWQAGENPVFLAWPQPMALDNHWIALPAV